MSSTQKWSAIAVLTVATILVGSWFLLVAPKRSEAADLTTKAAKQEQANARLVQKLEVLKAQSAELPAQKATLAKVRQQIPENPALPTLIRDLSAAGKEAGITLASLAPATPTPMVAAGAPVTTGTPAAGGLYQVALTVKASGSYFELEQFVNKLEKLQRSFLVTGFTLAAPEANSGTPATSGTAGELALSISGRVFVAAPATAAPAAAAGATGTTGAAGTTTTSTTTAQ